MTKGEIKRAIDRKEKELSALRKELDEIEAGKPSIREHNEKYIRTFIKDHIDTLCDYEGKFFIEENQKTEDTPTSIRVFKITRIRNIEEIRNTMNEIVDFIREDVETRLNDAEFSDLMFESKCASFIDIDVTSAKKGVTVLDDGETRPYASFSTHFICSLSTFVFGYSPFLDDVEKFDCDELQKKKMREIQEDEFDRLYSEILEYAAGIRQRGE